MRRTIQGVPFHVLSPSFLVLNAYNDGSTIEYCSLRFDGAAWQLYVEMKHGARHVRQFPSRDYAIEAMGGRALV